MEIKGHHVLAGFGAAFGLIVGVNVLMATQAVRTFPGLETQHSYMDSQRFDQERAAQEALGWDVSARLEGSDLVLAITDAEGRAVDPPQMVGVFGRATSVERDQQPAFVFDGTVHRAAVEAGPGNWNLRLRAVAGDGTDFRQRVIVAAE